MIKKYSDILIQNKIIVLVSVCFVIILVGSGIFLAWRLLKSNSAEDTLISDNNELSVKNDSGETQTYDFSEAPKHIGEFASIKGKVLKVFTSKSGVIFFDYCSQSSKCPFSAVIFASDSKKFKNLSQYEKSIEVNGVIRAYEGKAEIVINDPMQIKL